MTAEDGDPGGREADRTPGEPSGARLGNPVNADAVAQEREGADVTAGKSKRSGPPGEPENSPVVSADAAADTDDSSGKPQSGPDTAPSRRYPIGPVALLALAAAALWGSSRMTWVTLTSTDGLTEPRTDRLGGGVWFGALTPLALVLLASIAAVFATRGWPRRAVGALVALVAAVAAVPAFALLTHSGKIAERAAKLADLPARAQIGEATAATFPAVLALLGALAAFVAGTLLARMPAETSRLSGKYDNPVFRRAEASAAVVRRQGESPADARPRQLSERVLWDALDAGADPTEEPAGHDRPQRGGTGRDGE